MINSVLTGSNNISFGYASKLKKMIVQEYPYCALTGKKFEKGEFGPSTDHIIPRHLGGTNDESNYIIIRTKINYKKNRQNFRSFMNNNKPFIKYLASYYEVLTKSKNMRVAEYAKDSLNTVLTELSGMYSCICNKRTYVPHIKLENKKQPVK